MGNDALIEEQVSTDWIMKAHTALYSTDPVYRIIVKCRVDGTPGPVSEWSYQDWMDCLEEYQELKNGT